MTPATPILPSSFLITGFTGSAHSAHVLPSYHWFCHINSNMEIKQEASEKACKIKVEDKCVGPLDAFKIEIKEEAKRESAYDQFDYLESNEFAVNTEVEQDECKFTLIEEKQTTNDESCPQEKNKMIIMDTLHSSHSSQHTELKILNKKMKVKSGHRLYKCEICFKQFTKSDLKIHLRTHSEKKPYECEICIKLFKTKSELKIHLRVHTGEKPYKCETCLKQFATTSHVKRHLRIHTGKKPHKCEICLKHFTTSTHLKTHLRIHSGEKPYRCDVCFKQFSQIGSLKKHFITHTGEKNLTCEICLKQLTRKSHLKAHLLTHSEKKPYKCEICLKQFTTNHLKQHMRSHIGK
ncbi:unnamed protein product [Diabrotica balteata]|uniref:C2H2-type domain-containing protein n=1 Tax=Diabrotica balteata TaxID=107213 RepID=A0A9N9T864_DIABA|nr:unnamed protein product [Diabrotica balteata]